MQNVNASSRLGGIRNDETLNREQLSHLLRTATRIADDPNIIVIGSQAILGTFDAQNLPDEVTISVEADIAFRDKDRDFATALLAAELISKQVLMDRADMLDMPGAVIKRVRTLIMRCAKTTMS